LTGLDSRSQKLTQQINAEFNGKAINEGQALSLITEGLALLRA
jgi:hypothetical protein